MRYLNIRMSVSELAEMLGDDDVVALCDNKGITVFDPSNPDEVTDEMRSYVLDAIGADGLIDHLAECYLESDEFHRLLAIIPDAEIQEAIPVGKVVVDRAELDRLREAQNRPAPKITPEQIGEYLAERGDMSVDIEYFAGLVEKARKYDELRALLQ